MLIRGAIHGQDRKLRLLGLFDERGIAEILTHSLSDLITVRKERSRAQAKGKEGQVIHEMIKSCCFPLSHSVVYCMAGGWGRLDISRFGEDLVRKKEQSTCQAIRRSHHTFSQGRKHK